MLSESYEAKIGSAARAGFHFAKALAMFTALCVGLASQPVQAQQDKLVAAFEKDVKDSGLSVQKLPSKEVAGFIVPMKRPNLGSFDVLILLADDTVVFQVRVAKKSEITAVTPDLVAGLLAENFNKDYVKIGFNAGGDMMVRYDMRLLALDGDEVKFLVKKIADASDELAKSAAGFIKR
jgi:hypothetical protein